MTEQQSRRSRSCSRRPFPEESGSPRCCGRDDRRAAAHARRGHGARVGELALVLGVRGAQDYAVGPHALHLHLSLETWAADGLLAIFFFVAGLELKREFVAGDLRDPRRAALPVVAAVGGMIVPALVSSRERRRRRAVAGPSPPRPTSRSRWPCSR